MSYKNFIENPSCIPAEIFQYCCMKYSVKTFLHCLAVVCYSMENPCVSEEDLAKVAICALCHDLLEDTDASIEEITKYSGLDEGFLRETLGALTQRKGESETYVDYIIRLKNEGNMVSYIVKLADMKDHLLRTETLTEKLKKKYWEALPFLL